MMRRWLIVVAFLLVGCVEGKTAVPTATMLAERPLPAVTYPPTPTHILAPSSTDTASPTFPPATPDPLAPAQGILLPALSSQGQLAFVHNQVLFLETAIDANEFKPIAQYVTYTHWSPQGKRLLYGIHDRPEGFVDYDITWMLHDVQTNRSTPLREIISNLPQDFFGFPTWMENGHKILFGKPLRERSQITLEKNAPLKLNRVPKTKVKND